MRMLRNVLVYLIIMPQVFVITSIVFALSLYQDGLYHLLLLTED